MRGKVDSQLLPFDMTAAVGFGEAPGRALQQITVSFASREYVVTAPPDTVLDPALVNVVYTDVNDPEVRSDRRLYPRVALHRFGSEHGCKPLIGVD